MSILDESLRLEDLGDGRWKAATSPAYANRVGPYGGWIAALLMKSVLSQQTQGEPLAITVNFLGGCQDGALTGSTRLLRRSRTNEHWFSEFADETSALVASATVTLGLRRPTRRMGDMAGMPTVPEPDAVPPRPSFDNGPGFFKSYDVKQFDGKPFRVNATASNKAWVRDADGRPLDYVSLTAQADSPLPRVFLQSTSPSAIATMTMTVYFQATPEALAEAGGDYILVDADCRAGHDGFHDQTARLWTRSGQLLATTEQLVWYNLKPQS